MQTRTLALLLLISVALVPSAGARSRPGVTVFVHSEYRGPSQTFTSDVPTLRRTSVGDDQASSLRVEPGCRAILYGNSDYRGSRVVVEEDVPDLSWTPIGNDRLSSIEVDCSPRWDDERRGVVLYAGGDFRGTSQWFDHDDPDLRDDPIGNDHASSSTLR